MIIDLNLKATASQQFGCDAFCQLDDAESMPRMVAVDASDQFVLFSDGLLEAANKDAEQFGMARLGAALLASTAAARMDGLQDALVRHMGAARPHDDVSVLVIDCR